MSHKIYRTFEEQKSIDARYARIHRERYPEEWKKYHKKWRDANPVAVKIYSTRTYIKQLEKRMAQTPNKTTLNLIIKQKTKEVELMKVKLQQLEIEIIKLKEEADSWPE
jgi:transcription initiation factor TFIID subunit TAF12